LALIDIRGPLRFLLAADAPTGSNRQRTTLTSRRDIHPHPELGFEAQRTSDLMAAKLAEFGCTVYR
jgi:metal-dependent amidase/aminoacylase/carboxypeptidase family protein